MKSIIYRARGFTIVAAIFILVVLAALGAFIVTISTNQHIGSALDVQGVRAYQAARAGLEWGLYRQLQALLCDEIAVSFPLPAASTLSDFTVTVVCTDITDGSSSPAIHSYVILSTACNQPDAGNCPNTNATTPPNSFYIERRMEVLF